MCVQIKRKMMWMNNDLVICISNENAHIGSVVIGEPYYKENQICVTCQTWNRLTHKEEMVARMYVEAAVKKYGCVVTCICGIHIDDISKKQIEEIFENVKKDIKKI